MKILYLPGCGLLNAWSVWKNVSMTATGKWNMYDVMNIMRSKLDGTLLEEREREAKLTFSVRVDGERKKGLQPLKKEEKASSSKTSQVQWTTVDSLTKYVSDQIMWSDEAMQHWMYIGSHYLMRNLYFKYNSPKLYYIRHHTSCMFSVCW